MNAAWLNSQPLNTFGVGEVQILEGAAGLAATASATSPGLSLIQTFGTTVSNVVATSFVTVTRRRGYSAVASAIALSPPSEAEISIVRALTSTNAIASAAAQLFGSFVINLGADVFATAEGDFLPGRIDLEPEPVNAVAVTTSAAMFARRRFSRTIGAEAIASHTGEIDIQSNLFSSVSAVATQVNTYKVNSTVILSAVAEVGAQQDQATLWASVPMSNEPAFITATQDSYAGRYIALGAVSGAGVDPVSTTAGLRRIVRPEASAAVSAVATSPAVRIAFAPLSATAGASASHASIAVRVRSQSFSAVGVSASASAEMLVRKSMAAAATVAAIGEVEMTPLRWRPMQLLDYDATANPSAPDLQINVFMEAVAAAVAQQLAILFTNIGNEAPIARTITVQREGDPIVVAKQETGIVVYGE